VGSWGDRINTTIQGREIERSEQKQRETRKKETEEESESHEAILVPRSKTLHKSPRVAP
jgi:hypothetical protein